MRRPMSASTKQYDVKDVGLAKGGQDLIDWASREMPVLLLIRERFAREKPISRTRGPPWNTTARRRNASAI